MGKRADAVVIVRDVIFVIKFKVGATEFLAADQAQATDYALDLKNFHEGSHHAKLVPILIATKAIELPIPHRQCGATNLGDCDWLSQCGDRLCQ
jgi:hypothetical protein